MYPPDRDDLQGFLKPVAGLRCRPLHVWLFSCMEVNAYERNPYMGKEQS